MTASKLPPRDREEEERKKRRNFVFEKYTFLGPGFFGCMFRRPPAGSVFFFSPSAVLGLQICTVPVYRHRASSNSKSKHGYVKGTYIPDSRRQIEGKTNMVAWFAIHM